MGCNQCKEKEREIYSDTLWKDEDLAEAMNLNRGIKDLEEPQKDETEKMHICNKVRQSGDCHVKFATDRKKRILKSFIPQCRNEQLNVKKESQSGRSVEEEKKNYISFSEKQQEIIEEQKSATPTSSPKNAPESSEKKKENLIINIAGAIGPKFLDAIKLKTSIQENDSTDRTVGKGLLYGQREQFS